MEGTFQSEEWNEKMRTPTKKAYVQQISKEAYEYQSQEYTKKMLDELHNTMRKEPEFISKSYHFQKLHQKYQRQEYLFKFLVYAALVVAVAYLSFNSNLKPTESTKVAGSFAHLLCSSPSNTTEKKTSAQTEKELVFTPQFTLFFLVGVFLVWVVKMQLDLLHVKHTITWKGQIGRTLLDIVIPVLVICLFGFVFVLISNYMFDPNSCSIMIEKIMDVPFINDLIRASSSIINHITETVIISERLRAFAAFSVSLAMLYFIWKSIKSIILERSKIDLFTTSLIIAIAGMQVLEDQQAPAHLKRGEQYILYIILAKLFRVFVDGIYYWKSVPSETKTEKIIIESSDDDSDDKKEQ